MTRDAARRVAWLLVRERLAGTRDSTSQMSSMVSQAASLAASSSTSSSDEDEHSLSDDISSGGGGGVSGFFGRPKIAPMLASAQTEDDAAK